MKNQQKLVENNFTNELRKKIPSSKRGAGRILKTVKAYSPAIHGPVTADEHPRRDSPVHTGQVVFQPPVLFRTGSEVMFTGHHNHVNTTEVVAVPEQKVSIVRHMVTVEHRNSTLTCYETSKR